MRALKLNSLGELFAIPLQSAVKAQSLALQEAMYQMDQLGVEKGVAKKFSLITERMVEEKIAASEGKPAETKISMQPIEISIPVLGMVNPPAVQIQEVNVEFGVEIVETKPEEIRSPFIPIATRGISLSSSLAHFTPLGQSNPTTMKVNMKIVRDIPEGMARLNDMLTELISSRTPEMGVPKPPDSGTPVPPKTPPSIEKVPGIGREFHDVLKGRGILNLDHLLAATDSDEKVKGLAKVLGVTNDRILEWREKAKLILDGKE